MSNELVRNVAGFTLDESREHGRQQRCSGMRAEISWWNTVIHRLSFLSYFCFGMAITVPGLVFLASLYWNALGWNPEVMISISAWQVLCAVIGIMLAWCVDGYKKTVRALGTQLRAEGYDKSTPGVGCRKVTGEPSPRE